MDPDVLLLAILEILETTEDPEERDLAIQSLIDEQKEAAA